MNKHKCELAQPLVVPPKGITYTGFSMLWCLVCGDRVTYDLSTGRVVQAETPGNKPA